MMSLVPLFAERILNSLPLGTLLALLAWGVLRLGGRQDSRTRFTVWFVALLGIAALPFLHRSPLLSPGVPPAEFTVPPSWAIAVFVTWAALFFFAFMRIVVGLCHLRTLRLSSQPLSLNDCDPVLREALVAMQSSHNVGVHVSEVQAVPAAIGFFDPIILIPGWALRELPAEELRAILLHEFAHIQRRDSWTNLAQKVVKAIFFFHPAVWWIDKRLCLEREMACDDAVLSATGDPQAYAACLVSLAERSFMQRSIALAQAAVSRLCETSIRVTEILSLNRPRRAMKPAFAVFGAFAVTSLALLARTPQLIAFQKPLSNAPTSASTVMPSSRLIVPPASRRSTGNVSNSVIETPVIPAAFKAPAITHRVERRTKLVASKPQQAPKVVFAASQQERPAEVFLVVRTAQYDGMGRTLLSVTVWRVSTNPRTVNTEQNGVLPKSI